MKILIILFLALILRLINLSQSLWLDEAAQALESQNSISWLWQWMSADFNPPLYHFIIHFWLKLGQSEWLLRLPSVIFGVLTVYFLYLLAKYLVDQKFGLLVALLLAISPFHVYFSQELRMYSLSALLSVVSMYYFSRALKEDRIKFWVLYTISTILNFYTLYFSIFLFIGQAIYFCFNFYSPQRLRKFLITTAISFSSFLFWLPQFLVQLEGGRWLAKALPGWQEAVSTPVLKAPALVLVKFFLGQISFQNNLWYGLIALVLFFLFLILLFSAFGSKRTEPFWFFGCWLVIPLSLAILTSLVVPVVSPKRLLLTLPAFYGILSLGTLSVRKKWQIALTGVLIMISLLSLSVYYLNPKFQRENWREAVAYVENQSDKNSLALFEFSDPFAPYLWYRTGRIESRVFDGKPASPASVREKLPDITADSTRIFFFQYLTDLTDPQHLVPKWLEDHGWILTETKDFSGVGFIYTYEKSL